MNKPKVSTLRLRNRFSGEEIETSALSKFDVREWNVVELKLAETQPMALLIEDFVNAQRR